MRKKYFIPFICLLVFSCVPKKKLSSLQDQLTQSKNEKDSLSEAISKISQENDSLRELNFLLDSLLDLERTKLASLHKNDKKDHGGGVRSGSFKGSLPKEEEYTKKAAFIYNFANFISWPADKSEFFIIGVLGKSPISSYLNKLAAGKILSSKRVLILPLSTPDSFCHILFVGHDHNNNFNKIKKQLGNKPTLVITENIYLNQIGGHISFYLNRDKVSFLVNKSAIEKTGLKVSQNLMSFSAQ